MSVAEIKIILVDIDIVHIGESSHMSSTCCLAKHTSLHPIGTQHIQLIPSYIDTTSIIILPPLVIRVGVLSFVILWFSEIWPRFSHHNDDVNSAGPGLVQFPGCWAANCSSRPWVGKTATMKYNSELFSLRDIMSWWCLFKVLSSYIFCFDTPILQQKAACDIVSKFKLMLSTLCVPKSGLGWDVH